MIAFDNSYARLPERFYSRQALMPVASPKFIRLNAKLAEFLELDATWLEGPEGLALLAGNATVTGAEPLAMAYAGHQFGGFVPQLGDGRALLLGEVVAKDGKRYDLQLKGSGPTPFSRQGDGRAALGPVLREYIVSEAMAALGVPTTRALAAVTTGEPVYRETPLPGAILTRVASAHIRVGTFEYFTARGDFEAVRQLADYVIERLYPDLPGENRYLALLDAVIARQAELIAHWQSLGFIHGVMNTDNMSIAGETIDYGPCAFMEAYDPKTVFSSIDQLGRYAYANQPQIGLWNLANLAQCMLPLIDRDEDTALGKARDSLDRYKHFYRDAFQHRLQAKLGLFAHEDDDPKLIGDLLHMMEENGADFTNTFLALTRIVDGATGAHEFAHSLLAKREQFDDWAERWKARQAREVRHDSERVELMRTNNPVRIPRNHQVEAAIMAAHQDDFAPFEHLLDALANPYAEDTAFAAYEQPASPEEAVRETFCGT